MLSIEQYKIISEQLEKENSQEFIETLLKLYTENSTQRINDLLTYIPKLAAKQIEIKNKRILQYSWATDLLLGDRKLHPGKYKESDTIHKFPVLFYTCKAHFQSGNTEGQSKANIEFFNEFIELLKKKKKDIFDYTDEKDWDWVYTTAGGVDWLESVIKQNIDKDFVKPENKPRLKSMETMADVW